MQKIYQLPQNIKIFLNELKIQNYHKHTSYSNTSSPDSGAIHQDYVDRAKEIGSSILASGEHGSQGNYWEVYDLAKDNGLKFIFSTEAYWVKDRHEKDSTNAHIVLVAKNENGRRAINRILSDANIDGYYYKPRIDLDLIFSLPKDDVFITTACLAFWKYEDIDDIVYQLYNYFGENFMLEVQTHNTDKQKSLNRHILGLASKYDIDIICGLDSHYIHESELKDREFILEYKQVQYPDEDGWYLDYPDAPTVYNRFIEQGILSELQILNAINNTNIILEFEDIVLNKDIKLPNLFEDKTQEERNELYKELLNKGWEKERDNIPQELHPLYLSEIQKEAQVVINTNMADYFIDDYYMVKKAKEMGGLLTDTGRGSGVSFYTNKLLGFTEVDRISAPVRMYPERFMSEARILQTKSMPDLDLNWGNPEVAVDAQKIVFGEGHSYPMIAYGTLQVKSAFKMYAGANHIDFEIANNISKQIDEYQNVLKQTDEEDKDTIDVYDFVDEKYHYLLDDSEKYRGIIMDKKKHPCGYLIYQGNIKEEIGLIKVKSESTKKEYICAMIDGAMADKYGYVKNDLLKVEVVNLIKKTYEKIGIPIMPINELNEILKSNKEMQRVYTEGITMGINQFEGEGTRKKSTKYKPINVSEMTAFVAGIRPSFKSMYDVFERRESFEYGIPTFDRLVQTEEIKDSFLLYQEQLMQALAYSGIPMDETMTLIKAISKKKTKVIMGYKDRFLLGFANKILEDENCTKDVAKISADKVWKIIESSARYGFNASHAYCVANDSMYGAYLKSHYPYDFYETALNIYSQKKEKNKMSLFKQEMVWAYGIKDGEFKFRRDNRKFVADIENRIINPDLSSIKGIGYNVAEELYSLKDNEYSSFLDLMPDLVASSIKKNQLETLIKLDYFSEFGKRDKIEKTYKVYKNIGNCKVIAKSKFEKPIEDIISKHSRQTTSQYRDLDNHAIMNEILEMVEDKDMSIGCILNNELEYLGYNKYINKDIPNKYLFVTDKSHRGKHPIFTFYRIHNGDSFKAKVKINNFNRTPFGIGNILSIDEKHLCLEPKWKLSEEYVTEENPNGFYQDEEDKELILKYYKIRK